MPRSPHTSRLTSASSVTAAVVCGLIAIPTAAPATSMPGQATGVVKKIRRFSVSVGQLRCAIASPKAKVAARSFVLGDLVKIKCRNGVLEGDVPGPL